MTHDWSCTNSPQKNFLLDIICCLVNVLILNVNCFFRSTLHRLPNSPLANSKFLKEHYRPEKKEYFFDRDPDVFRVRTLEIRPYIFQFKCSIGPPS